MLTFQSNPCNLSRIATVIVAAITSNLSLADAPGNVRVVKSESSLSGPPVVNVSKIVTVDRSLPTQRARTLGADGRREVDEGIKKILGV